MNYDLIVLGSGPGGYVAAIRASQLGLKVAVVEKAELGGVCLNWGCIPTKALLKSAQVFDYLNHASEYGVSFEGKILADLPAMVKRSREVAEGMSKGIQYLFKKNKIDHIAGFGKVLPGKIVEVYSENRTTTKYGANHIIIATGARSRELENLPIDGVKIIGYRQALVLDELPGSMVVVGSGAIGSEFAYFFNALGSRVTLVEYMPNIVPVEDEEVSKQLERSFKKAKMKVITSGEVISVDTSGEKCKVLIRTKSGEDVVEADVVLSAVGIKANIEGIGLEETGIKTENGKIVVDKFYRTSTEGYYAIGDVVPGQALAHVASAEGIICVEKIAGHNPEPLDYNNIPGCTYCVPEVASVGYTEAKAREAGYDLKIGKFPFTASGKASAAGAKDGFVKVIFDAKYGELLGVHMIGANVTEIIAEAVVARKLETTAHEIIKAVHPHPTMSEAFMEAAAAAYGEVIHL
ncbi:MAG TPA: dihydrolipoyl dehydrogenase [Bacteroidales bacterium]|nr:dihydrolipoyl dehydrogenase [Bacteroidales bacterium]